MPADAKCMMPVPDDAPSIPPHPTLGPARCAWTYCDSSGQVLGYVLRWNRPTADDSQKGKSSKEFRPLTLWQHADGRLEWRWERWPKPWPLYGLDRLAARPDAPVLVVEGEKSADAAAARFPDHVAITSGGSTSAPHADWKPLQGRKVVIWPDHDEAGQGYAAAVAELAYAAGATSVRIVSFQGTFPQGWDLADDSPVETNADRLRTMLDTAQPVEPSAGMPVDEWPELESLPELPSVAPFDYSLLPEALRPWVEDVAERTQCPPDFVAVGAMVTLGAAIGRRVAMRPKQQDNWTVVPNLWGMIVGRPGVMKSPALSEAKRSLQQLEDRAQEDHEKELAEWRHRVEIAEMQRDAAKKKMKKAIESNQPPPFNNLPNDPDEPEPKATRFIVNSATVEAVAEVLRENPNGVLVYRDELVSLMRTLDDERKAEDRGFYLTAWNGTDSYTTDRIGRGLNLRVKACCLSMLGGTQPAAISSYLADAVETGGGDGMLARFNLLVWPDIAGEWKNIDRWPNAEARSKAHLVFGRMVAIDGEAIGQKDDHGDLPFLRFDPEAQALFDDWRASLEPRLRSGEEHPAFESHLAKYKKLVPALALILHLADAEGEAVSEAALRKALAWASYLETHAKRAYAAVTAGDASPARALLRRIQKGDVRDGFTEREIYRKEWSGLGQQEVAMAATVLAAHGYLRPEVTTPNKAGGRPKKVWRIHPDVLASCQQAAQHAA